MLVCPQGSQARKDEGARSARHAKKLGRLRIWYIIPLLFPHLAPHYSIKLVLNRTVLNSTVLVTWQMN